MALSNELVTQFVKAVTNDSEKPSETVSYGTIKISDGVTYVQLDGATVYTPVTSTTLVSDGDRVTVMIKDHSAVVTGNLSSPSATQGSVDEAKKELGTKIDEFDIIIADKVSVEQLDAVKGQIKELSTNSLTADSAIIRELQTADVTISGKLDGVNATLTGKLEAHDGKFENIDASFIQVNNTLTAVDAKIGTLEATDAEFRTVESDYGNFKTLTTDNFTAVNGEIVNLKANKADVSKLTAVEADITKLQTGKLDADSAVIKDLQADVADIDTLIFGDASGDTIHTSFANAVIAQLGNAQIKSAMIDSISAGKITAGDIVTKDIRVMSEDGKLLISDETIQISDATRVRVQIGKDSSDDYSINVWDADGNLMFSEGGITDNAIKNAIIRNDMVSDTANISASKLNISSLFTEINEHTGEETLKSSKIFLDDQSQTLDLAFTSMESDVVDLSNNVYSQGTQLSVIQGQIESKVWQQEIDDAKSEMTTQYSQLQQTVGGIGSTVASLSSGYSILGENISSVESGLASVSDSVMDNASAIASMGRRNILLDSGNIEIYTNSPNITGSVTDEGHLKIAVSGSFAAGDDGLVKLLIGDHEENRKRVSAEFSDGDLLTFSLMMKMQRSCSMIGCIQSDICGPHMLNCTTSDPGWYLYWYTGTWKSAGSFAPAIWFNGPVGIIGDQFEIKNCKLEHGNAPTCWTPAPEDVGVIAHRVTSAQTQIDQNTEAISLRATKTEVETTLDGYYTKSEADAKIEVSAAGVTTTVRSEITDASDNATSTTDKLEKRLENAEATIRQLSDSISMMVRSGKGGSLVTLDDETGLWYFDISDFEKNLESTASELNDLSGIVLDESGRLDVLNTEADALAKRTEYVRSYTDEDDNPCLELGEGDSRYKVLITNTGIRLEDGTDAPAALTNKVLLIEKSVVRDEQQIGYEAQVSGVWVWKRRANGNLGLSWKGGVE